MKKILNKQSRLLCKKSYSIELIMIKIKGNGGEYFGDAFRSGDGPTDYFSGSFNS